MGKPKQAPKKRVVDPFLTQALKEAPVDATVQAVFTLRTPAGQDFRESDSTRATVDKILGKAASSAKAAPHRLVVYPNTQSFALAGPPALVRAVLKHDDVASAMANIQKEDLLIRPVPAARGRRKPPGKKKRQR